jgi:hypothetical protein
MDENYFNDEEEATEVNEDTIDTSRPAPEFDNQADKSTLNPLGDSSAKMSNTLADKAIEITNEKVILATTVTRNNLSHISNTTESMIDSNSPSEIIEDEAKLTSKSSVTNGDENYKLATTQVVNDFSNKDAEIKESSRTLVSLMETGSTETNVPTIENLVTENSPNSTIGFINTTKNLPTDSEDLKVFVETTMTTGITTNVKKTFETLKSNETKAVLSSDPTETSQNKTVEPNEIDFKQHLMQKISDNQESLSKAVIDFLINTFKRLF